MFEFLMQAPESAVTKAVYDASLRLYERKRFPRGREPLPEPRPSRGGPAPWANAEPGEIVAEIVERIERAEAAPLGQFTDETAGHYISELSDLLMERIRRDHPDPEGRGAKLLQELREQYAVI